MPLVGYVWGRRRRDEKMIDELTEKLNLEKNKIGLVGTRLSFSRPQQGKGISEQYKNQNSKP